MNDKAIEAALDIRSYFDVWGDGVRDSALLAFRRRNIGDAEDVIRDGREFIAELSQRIDALEAAIKEEK